MVSGEALEFPITLDFVPDVTVTGYEYEAVVVEGLNVALQEEPPTQQKPVGESVLLTVRLPVYAGVWSGTSPYNTEDVVSHGSVYYKLLSGSARVSAIDPSVDPLWEVTTMSKLYVQFPTNILADWVPQPQAGYPVYGFFELRVTEPNNTIFRRTWKPVRGLVEIQFSPTDQVV